MLKIRTINDAIVGIVRAQCGQFDGIAVDEVHRLIAKSRSGLGKYWVVPYRRPFEHLCLDHLWLGCCGASTVDWAAMPPRIRFRELVVEVMMGALGAHMHSWGAVTLLRQANSARENPSIRDHRRE